MLYSAGYRTQILSIAIVDCSDFQPTLLTETSQMLIIEPTGRRTRRALEKGEKYCPLPKIDVKKKVVKTQNKKI